MTIRWSCQGIVIVVGPRRLNPVASLNKILAHSSAQMKATVVAKARGTGAPQGEVGGTAKVNGWQVATQADDLSA
eukprot:scaffold308788_cov32-Tisochrysis_lutea.AAC.1